MFYISALICAKYLHKLHKLYNASIVQGITNWKGSRLNLMTAMTQHFLIRPGAGAIIISSTAAAAKQNLNFCWKKDKQTNKIWNIIKLLLFKQIACLQILINLISRTKELGLAGVSALFHWRTQKKTSLTLGWSSLCCCCCCYCGLLAAYSQARQRGVYWPLETFRLHIVYDLIVQVPPSSSAIQGHHS